MKFLCSQNQFTEEFGVQHAEARLAFDSLLLFKDDHVTFKFDLASIFTEPMELFSVDSSLVQDVFILSKVFNDESIHPGLLITLTDLIQNAFEFDPISSDGECWMSFSDIRDWYGETFDHDMERLFPGEYGAFKEYFLE